MNIGATGKAGEDAALRRYEEMGFTLVERNFQTRYGEIDLILKNDRFLVFAEVKTRTPNSRMGGIASMSRSKMQKIFKTALVYMQSVKFDLQPRFDVVDIMGNWLVQDGKEIFCVDKLTIYDNSFGSEVYRGFV